MVYLSEAEEVASLAKVKLESGEVHQLATVMVMSITVNGHWVPYAKGHDAGSTSNGIIVEDVV